MLSGVTDAIEIELSRAEAFDRDLLVISAPEVTKGPAQLNQIRDSLGANLVLASSAVSQAKHVQLSLKVLDTGVDRVLRQKVVICGLDQLTLMAEKAVRAAAELLGVSRYVEDNGRLRPSTQSAEAYQAFQAAEASRRQPNDAGLDKAIEQYKAAVEQDDRYALAHARLAMAYCRQYALRREPAALDLVEANAKTSLGLDRNLVEGHLALGWVLEHRGQKEDALAEMGKALALDPSNPRTLVWQAQVYSRLNQSTQAEETFRRVLRARPNYWLAYNELGEVLNRNGKYREAMQAYRAASLAQPKNALAMNNIGELFLKLGQLKEARESLRRSLALKFSGLAAANMAQELRAEGKYAEALLFALKAVDVDPADDQYWLELGDCYSSLPGYRPQARKAYSRAAAEIEHHLQMDESDGPSWMLLALYQAKTGKLEAARATTRKAESLGASELDSQIFKVRILELTKQREEALATVAACFQKGATKFQIDSIPDLQFLRADPRYRAIFSSERVGPGTEHRPN
jgi:Tfp pilus assembly protein PilF